MANRRVSTVPTVRAPTVIGMLPPMSGMKEGTRYPMTAPSCTVRIVIR